MNMKKVLKQRKKIKLNNKKVNLFEENLKKKKDVNQIKLVNSSKTASIKSLRLPSIPSFIIGAIKNVHC